MNEHAPERIRWAVDTLDVRPDDRLLELVAATGLPSPWPAIGSATDGKLEAENDSFTKVFAINLNLFWTRPALEELAVIRRLLTPGGALYLFYEAPSDAKSRAIADSLARLPGATLVESPSPTLVGALVRP